MPKGSEDESKTAAERKLTAGVKVLTDSLLVQTTCVSRSEAQKHILVFIHYH